ncbi:MAG TPA: hypothetical protein VIT91_05305 [Chthoniobacterales bacterium]
MKHRTQLLLDDHHYAFLKREAQLRRCSISSALRSLLQEKMETMARNTAPEDDPVFEIAGKYASGHTDTAEKAEEILYGSPK